MSNPESTATRKRTILLVDDEENILTALRRVLRREGYQILTANSGRDGLEQLGSHAVDVIVSDQRMPGMSGVEFLRQARASRPETVRIVLSGYTELQSITDAINEGAIYKFMTKPWDDEQIRANIAEAFHHKELADENRRLTEELAVANRELQALLAEKQRRLELDEVSLDIAREVLYCVPLPLIGIDNDGQVVFANRVADTLLADGASLCGEFAADCLPSEWLALLHEEHPGDLDWQTADSVRKVLCRDLGAPRRRRGRLLVVMSDGSASSLLPPGNG
ncbi:MAG: response regulator [Candidatus Accumulibacter phosphatis]|nr:response regulator [Candidatus Accumulibacter phosphatis]